MPLIANATGEDRREYGRSVPRTLEGLLRQLEDADAGKRRWAARDLSGMPGAAGALCERLRVENDPTVREAILTSLIEIGEEPVAWSLVELLVSEDAAFRSGVMETLGQMGAAAEEAVEANLRHPDPDQRLFAVNILQMIGGERARELLARLLLEEPEVNVCAAAAEALAEIGDVQALGSLRALPHRFPDEGFIAFVSDVAIARISEFA